jgi:hypothetical protein
VGGIVVLVAHHEKRGDEPDAGRVAADGHRSAANVVDLAAYDARARTEEKHDFGVRGRERLDRL